MNLAALSARIALVLLAASGALAQTRPAYDDKIAVFGTLHAHSSLSGDVSDANGFTPREAFNYAREHGLDFLGISDHHQETTGQYHLDATDYADSLYAVALGLNTQHAGDFVAIPGIEWGHANTGNHINVFGAPTLPVGLDGNGDYAGLFDWIIANALFAQGNHPYSWHNIGSLDTQVGNYGRDLFDDSTAFVARADGALLLMSIICTVEYGHSSGQHRHSEAKTHRDMKSAALEVYHEHLNMGFHLSPAGNQDTHWKNPGTVTAARTGVWVDEFTLEGIAEGIQANRVFATEDDELAVAMQVQYDGKTYWMGETVELSAVEQDVTVTVMVIQGAGSDGDSPDEGPYTATLYSDTDGIGGGEAAKWETFEIPIDTGILEVTLPVTAGEYFYMVVQELGGSDNLVGEGDDDFSVDGSVGSDGFRDDPNDLAWTSPIWMALGSVSGPFVWSVKSGIYHEPDCWVVKRIGSANRREGDTPEGKSKHDCHP